MVLEVTEELNPVGGHIGPVIRAYNSFLEVFLKNAGQTVEAYFLPIESYPPIFLLASSYRSDKFDDVHTASFQ
jgi:hypothetical protein